MKIVMHRERCKLKVVRKVKEVYAVGAEDTSDRVDVDYGFALTTGVEERGARMEEVAALAQRVSVLLLRQDLREIS